MKKEVLQSVDLILNGYDHARSFNLNFSMDHPLPWMTYPLVDYIRGLDISHSTVYEFGSGLSTIYWGLNAKSVISVENNIEWYDNISLRVPGNVKVLYRPEADEYVNSILDFKEKFNIIVIDGHAFRYECAINSLACLADGGFIVLDDTDNIKYNEISTFLRDNGLIQIDFIGLKSGLSILSATSIFIKRDFDFKPKFSIQPKIFIGKQRCY